MNTSNFLNQIRDARLPGISAHKEMSFTNRNFDKPPNAVQSAVAILTFEQNNQLFFPLIKRPLHIKHHKGQIALPGGKLNENESIFDCVKRETEEEIAVPKQHIIIVKQLTELYIPVSNHLVFPIVCYSEQPPALSHTSDEVDKMIWCSIQDLLQFEKQTAKVKITDELWIDAPAFIYKNEIIWGATALILNEFKHLILSIKNG
ncbi:MAG: CoA pyrophosphatase [Bacteroidia bacterium]